MFSPPGNDPVPELGGEKGKDLRGAVGGGSVLLEPVLPSGGPSPDGRPDYLFLDFFGRNLSPSECRLLMSEDDQQEQWA